mgnify:CR=1 FL=1
MFKHFWLVFKEFLMNHTQHARFETTLTVLAIAGGAAVIVLGVLLYIKIIKYIKLTNKNIRKNKRASNKNILILLKKKKNVTF